GGGYRPPSTPSHPPNLDPNPPLSRQPSDGSAVDGEALVLAAIAARLTPAFESAEICVICG
ncbi:MAG: hypothetical protein ACM3NQ_08790, partial [Bacteroidales bacterium]